MSHLSILITGGAGFIGSHLCERLLQQGNKVLVVDNMITGNPRNLELLKQYGEAFRFLQHDITQPLKVDGVFDIVCNLACPASPIDYQRIPLETLWVSAAGTKNMLEFALAQKALFFHTSTSEVYGDPLEHPQTERYLGNVNCLGPRSCYDEGKRFAESLIMNYHQTFKLPVKMVRIFNTYGPRMRKKDGRVIPNFITQALAGEPITLYGDGEQTRSFCYIDDMVDGICAMLNKSEFLGPVNLGNPEEVRIKRLAEKIVELTHSSSPIVYKPLPQDDPKVRQPDITLAHKELHFQPRMNLDEGLKATIAWFSSSPA